MTSDKIILGIVVVLAIGGLGAFLFRSTQSTGELDTALSPLTAPSIRHNSVRDERPMIEAQVDGCVAMPGRFKISKGSRVRELIEKAGGILPNGDDSGINYAAKVRDGQRVRVPQIKPMASFASPTAASPHGHKIGDTFDLQTASLKSLQDRYDISKSGARCIVQYRSQMGWIQSDRELLKIPHLSPSDRAHLERYLNGTISK